MARGRQKTRSGDGFPILRALVILALLWGSLWVAGMAGSAAGGYVYDRRYAPQPPYSEEQLRSMERVSDGAAEVARHDLRIWEETVAVGRSVARVEGALAGSMIMLALWGTLAAFWLWSRERDRALRGPELERPARA